MFCAKIWKIYRQNNPKSAEKAQYVSLKQIFDTKFGHRNQKNIYLCAVFTLPPITRDLYTHYFNINIMRKFATLFCLLSVLFSAKAQDLTLEDYFTRVAPNAEATTTDNEGFIRRWMLLEPISKPNRGNTVFTDSYVRAAFDTVYYAGQKTMLPKDGQKVKVVVPIEQQPKPQKGAPAAAPQMDFRRFQPLPPVMTKMTLKWHALDSKRFNVKLYRFYTGLNLQHYGVVQHAVTVVYAEEDMEVRLAVGSNSASMWWLNGEEALILSGDRRMVKDDATSRRIMLKKGANILRGNIINGPGMSDFCVRFIDEAGNPVKNLKVNVK